MLLNPIKSMVRVVGAYKNRRTREKIIQLVNSAVNSDNTRNKVIITDFMLERDTSPQDGFELFRYMVADEGCPFEPCYIMNEGSACYSDIKKRYGDRIIPFSEEKIISFGFELAELLKTTRFICSGFQVMHALNLGITDAVRSSPCVCSVFTQHGVNFFKNSFISKATYSAFLFDRIMVSNESEKRLFMEKGLYRENQIIRNGLFRWDLLAPRDAEDEKSIFIYFTHRRYLHDLEDIRESAYFKAISSLLGNERLQKLIASRGLKLRLAMHHSIVPLMKNAFPRGTELVSDEDIAEVKRTASLLITDYSSMCFEMWFQHKPVIFLSISDSADCLKYGHKTDLAEPYGGNKKELPNIAQSAEECVKLLYAYTENNFTVTHKEKELFNSFFYYRRDFCRRFTEYLQAPDALKKDSPTVKKGERLMLADSPQIHTWGLAPPDEKGRTFVEKSATIGFIVPDADENLSLSLAFLAETDSNTSVKFFVGSHFIKKEIIGGGAERKIQLEIPRRLIPTDKYIKINLHIKYGSKPDLLRITAIEL